jgi:hypothetical protein
MTGDVLNLQFQSFVVHAEMRQEFNIDASDVKRFSLKCRGWTTPVPTSDPTKTAATQGIGTTVTTVTTLFSLGKRIRKKE